MPNVSAPSLIRTFPPALAALLCIVGMGCADPGSTTNPIPASRDTESTTVETPTLDNRPPDTEPEDAFSDESLRRVYVNAEHGCGPADPAFDHPFDARSAVVFDIIPEIHAGLFVHSPDGVNVQLDLAESFSASDDFTVFEFALRDGLKFSDGTPLTARDVKWSWERAFAKANANGRAADVFGSIEGADRFRNGADEIEGITISSDTKLNVALEQPRPDFINLLTDPVAYVLKKDNVEIWTVRWDNASGIAEVEGPLESITIPIGAGPYMLAQYNPDLFINECILIKNEHYWSPHVMIEEVIVSASIADHIGNSTSADPQQILEKRLADYFSVGLANPSDLNPTETHGETVTITDAPKTWFIMLNTAYPPFDDLAFRRAIVAGTDAAEVFPGTDIDTIRLVPHAIAGSESKIEPISFNLEAAATQLGSSRYSDVDDHSITFAAGGLARAILPPIFDQWKRHLNLQVQLVSTDLQTDQPNGSPLSLVFIAPAYPDPHAILRGFADPFGSQTPSQDYLKLKDMLEDASAIADTSERNRRYTELEQYILDNALAIPLRLDHFDFEFRVQPWLRNLTVPQYGGSIFRDLKIATEIN